MRISTQQQYNLSIQRMQTSNTNIGLLQRQIDTGKKLHQPSDNPAVAAEVVRLTRDIAALDRYDGNMEIAENRLKLEETSLRSMITQMDRMREELSISAGSGTKTSAELKVIAVEVREIVASLAGAMNKQDSQGEYIYSGSKGLTQPYVLNEHGRWEYHGDNGQRDIQVGATHYIASNDSGQYLFENVEGELRYGTSGATFIDPDTQFYFDDAAAEEKWEAWAKENIQGDMHIRKRVIEADSATPADAEYAFEIVDSSGKVHRRYPDPAPATPVRAALTGEAQKIEFNGLTINLNLMESDEYAFPQQNARNGVEKITITDQAALDQFFADYGEVQLKMDTTVAGSETYQLISARTGAAVSIGGEDTFPMTPLPADINFGGMTFNVNPPAGAVTTHTLEIPSKDFPVTEIGAFATAKVANAATFEALMQDTVHGGLPAPDPVKGTQLRLEVTGTGPLTYQILDHAGNTVRADGPATLTPSGDAIQDATTGLNFEFGGALQAGDAITLQLRDPSGTPTAFAESTVQLDYEQKNILNIGLELAEQLEKGNGTPALQSALDKQLDDALDFIAEARDRVLEAVTAVGSRLSSMEVTKTANEDMKLFTKTTLSAIEDTDLPEAASKLKFEQLLLQASQQTFASVTQLSLFNYIG